jgi:hypothetical protein
MASSGSIPSAEVVVNTYSATSELSLNLNYFEVLNQRQENSLEEQQPVEVSIAMWGRR